MSIFSKMFGKLGRTKNRSVFIIEDNLMYGRSLKTFIESSFPDLKKVVVFPNGEKFLKELDENPTVIIVDYFLNSKYVEADNGLEIIRQIKRKNSKANIIVLSSQQSPGVIIEAIRDHECKYVSKDKEAFQHVERLIKDFLNAKESKAVGTLG